MRLARCGIALLTAVSLVLTSWPLQAQTVDGAAEARALAPVLTPDAKTLFQLEDGTVTLEGGGEIPLEELFPGEGDAAPPADTYGDEAGMVEGGHAAQEQLQNAPTNTGEAYRTLLDSPYDGPRDLSHEPWFDNTRTILGDVERLGGELGRCVPTQVVGHNPRTVWQPDLRVCTRSAQEPTTGACRLEHSLSFSEQNAFARVGVYGTEINSFRLDFANGSWTQIAPSDGSNFAGEVPQLDQAALCGGAATTSFTLTPTGTWAAAPVPGELDDTITVTVPQQPSCANGLQAIVRLTDPGGAGKFKSGSELGLHILSVTDEWWPQACLDIAQGQELPAACTITATAVGPPDQQGCANHDGRRICQGDPLWQAIPPPPFDPAETQLSRLADGADINWSCPAGTDAVPVTDTCPPLQSRPECKLKSTQCVAGTEDAAGNCTVVEDTYDCGREVVIDDGSIRTELQCDGEVKCLGDTCTGGTQETNPNFADAAAILKGAELAALDGACNPETGQCAVFTGEHASCKRVLAADIDCCQDVQGVSLANYLELAFAISSLGGAMATLDTTSPLRGAWEFMASPLGMSWDWIGGQFTSALNGVTGSTTASTSASESLGILGAAQQQLMRATAQWTLETFGPAATNALFTVNGGAAVAADGTLATGTVQVGGYAAVVGGVLYWVGIAYAVYQIAMILAQIIWACEEEELELAVRRELKQCTNLGSYCDTDTIAGCLVSKRSYCCYSSPFSRILQEQVRPQLGLTMGDAEDPDCSGIPLQDLAKIDWSKVDLEEWIAMLATNGQLPDAESITVERLTGTLRAIDSAAFAGQTPAATARAAAATPMAAAAAVPGGTGRRPDVIERTLARTEQTDIPAALTAARDELMPYLHPGGGAPKPQPETYDLADIPPELLVPWHLPNRWMDQLPPDPGPVLPPPPIDPGVPPAGPCGGRSGLSWASGVSPGTGAGAQALANTTGFGNWRGRAVDVAAVFIGKNSWTDSYAAFLTNPVLGPDGAVRQLSQHGICPVLTVPLVTKADFMRFDMVAAGGIDREHQLVAAKIQDAIAGGTIYLRVGHEADEGYPWSYTNQGRAADPGQYRAAWRRIAAIYRHAVPSARIVWNVLKNTRLKVTDYYPGDDVVDVISIDVYDNGSGGYCDAANSPGWLNYCYGNYNAGTGISKGINGILQFARQHGKRIAVDEWGATNDTLSAANGANNAFFVAGMHDFFATHADSIEYESYYNRAGGGRHQIWPKTSYNPLPSDAYLARYRDRLTAQAR